MPKQGRMSCDGLRKGLAVKHGHLFFAPRQAPIRHWLAPQQLMPISVLEIVQTLKWLKSVLDMRGLYPSHFSASVDSLCLHM